MAGDGKRFYDWNGVRELANCDEEPIQWETIKNIDPLYYNNSEKIDKREEYLINSIPEQYLINKVGGGLRLDGIDSLKSFIDTYKKRKLD